MILEPLKQWICDTCGQIIVKPEDGYVQFNRDINGQYDDFIIVHHATTSPLRGTNRKNCYKYDSDCDLESFLGHHGLVEVLSFIDAGPYHLPDFSLRVSNIRKWADFVKRLQLPYYEQARMFWNRASSDGYFGDSNEIYIYTPGNLKRMIEHYNKIDGKK